MFWSEGAGSNPGTVRVETNKVEPRFSTILKLAEALKVEPSELVDQG